MCLAYATVDSLSEYPLMPEDPNPSGSPSQSDISSGKSAKDENFPVGSWLLSRKARPHILTFYAYARAIDDIADSATLPPQAKIRRLEAHALAIRGEAPAEGGPEKAIAMRKSLLATGITAKHCQDLISAFKQDATKLRYKDWSELMDYCYRSAAPVGRYLIDLHGETRAAYPASDALCNALQVLNHLQDCSEDYRSLNRVYLPQEWMREAGTSVVSLEGAAASSEVRRVLDNCLDATDDLLMQARKLPDQIRDRRFAMEAATIVQVAIRLSRELRRRDPLAERVVLSASQYISCFVSGILAGLLRVRRPRVMHATHMLK